MSGEHDRVLSFNKANTRGGNEPGVGSSTEPKPQLPERNRWWRRRRLRSKPKLGEQCGRSLIGGGGFKPAHGPAAADTSVEVYSEHMSQEPDPALTGRASVVSLGFELGELKLVARSRRRLESGRILWRFRCELGAKLGVV